MKADCLLADKADQLNFEVWVGRADAEVFCHGFVCIAPTGGNYPRLCDAGACGDGIAEGIGCKVQRFDSAAYNGAVPFDGFDKSPFFEQSVCLFDRSKTCVIRAGIFALQRQNTIRFERFGIDVKDNVVSNFDIQRFFVIHREIAFLF